MEGKWVNGFVVLMVKSSRPNKCLDNVACHDYHDGNQGVWGKESFLKGEIKNSDLGADQWVFFIKQMKVVE